MQVAKWIGTAVAALVLAHSASAIQPNIIVIMGDDLPVSAVSAYGAGIGGIASTTNIDAIATAGVKFTNSFYLTAVCTPGRVALFTGQPPWGFNQVYFNGNSLSNTVATLMDALPGYNKHVIGKWQVPQTETGTVTAADLGWTTTDICTTGECGAYTDAVFESGASVGNVTDVITSKAITYMDARTAGTPLLLVLSHKATHDPWIAAATELDTLNATAVPEPATFNDDRSGRAVHVQNWSVDILELFTTWIGIPFAVTYAKPQPGVGVDTDPERRSFVYLEYARDVLENATSLDRNVGLITAYLAAEDLVAGELGFPGKMSTNTVVIVIGDNGLAVGDNGNYSKLRAYDAASQMVLIASGPASTGIVPNSTRTQMVSNLDLAPTIVTIGGVAPPAAMVGRSLTDLFPATPTGAAWRTGTYIHIAGAGITNEHARHVAYVTPEWKLIKHFFTSAQSGPEWELINRTTDPGETVNVYNSTSQATIDTLKAAMLAEQIALGLPSFLDMSTASSTGGMLP